MINIVKYDDSLSFKSLNITNFDLDISNTVAGIIEDVINNGDIALKKYGKKFDNVELSDFLVSQTEIEEALNSVDSKFINILKSAAINIKRFHINQLRQGFKLEENGTIVGQKISPIENVGLYVPGGTAAYPSTVLMDAIPAKIAGCKEIIITTPPMPNGKINPIILAAASIAGVTKIFKIGGAQAIAALAYGTQSVPKVDKIVGPGNVYVAEAKRQVFGQVSIDMIAGPSEILIISDEKTKAKNLAIDLLSQAEHDKNATAILITTSDALAKEVQSQIEKFIKTLPREEIARASIDNNGKIFIVQDIKTAIEISNNIAPEHLELCVDNAMEYLPEIKNAGSVFLGRYCPEALGDYFAGPNHTLPTSGTARFSNPLSVDDFITKTQFTYYTEQAFSEVAKDIAYFANKEGLDAHAKSALSRLVK